MTSDDYFRGPSGTRYTYAEIADRIRREAPHALGKHISVQLEAIGLLDEMTNGTTPCALPFTFAEAAEMADAEPTPGGWHYAVTGPSRIDGCIRYYVASSTRNIALIEGLEGMGPSRIAEANARLIAAAPAQAIILALVQRGLMTLEEGEAEFDGTMYWFDPRQADWCVGVVNAIGWDVARSAIAGDKPTGIPSAPTAPRLLASLEAILPYAENEAYSLEKLKDSPEAEAEAQRAWKAVEAAQAIVAQASGAGILPAVDGQPPRFEFTHEPEENSDRAYVLVDGKFDVAIIRTDEGVVVDVYPRHGIDSIASTYAFDTDAEAEESEEA
jgi:hypothetical protein